jgi:hypothetical protein
MAEFVITAPDGKKYKVTGANKEGALAALKKRLAVAPASPGHDRMNAQSEAAIQQAKLAGPNPGTGAFAQGGLMNFGDEMIGAIEAAKSGFQPGVYTQTRDDARAKFDAAVAESPGANIGGALTTGIPAAIATGGTSLPGVIAANAGLGGLAAYGGTEGNDLKAVGDTALGTAIGGAGGAAGYGLGQLISKFMARGLASETIQRAMDGKVDDLLTKVRQLGGSPAEADGVLQEVLRGQAAKNATAAANAIPGAQQRMAQVNAQASDEISRIISPENVAGFTQRTQDATRAAVRPGYDAARANPAQIGLTPEMASMPGMDDALAAAKELADFQKRPFDPGALTVEDLDVMQRFLRISKEKAFQGTPLETLKGPFYGTAREEVNALAGQASPELAEAQAKVALQKSVEEATELGKQALNPSKEAVEVAQEFAGLSPEAQQGYLSAVASRLRAQLAMRGSNANAANILDKPAIIEKLKALGFPAEAIDGLVTKGAGARGVLDALQGGSDTARKLAAAAASESPMTKLKPQDLLTGILHWSLPGVMTTIRAAGASQERKAAEMLIKALTAQTPDPLSSMMRNAPQNLRPLLGLLAGAGANTANQKRQSQ